MMRLTHNRAAAGRLLALVTLLAALTAASLMLAGGPAHASTTFYVNSTEDHADALLTGDQCDTGYDLPGGGQVDECTLRAAIQQANYTAGADAINFNVPGTGVHTIAPATGLPEITGPVSINGYTQPGAHPNTKAVGTDAVLKIELSKASASSGSYGLQITASNSTVKGLVINRWGNEGILINTGATGNRVVGNYLGTDASGTQDLGNTLCGVCIYGANNTVGGTTAAERNVISGNNVYGIKTYSAAQGTKVMGNYIGTDATGTKDLGNDVRGVLITSANNTVGGATAGERNVISGNNGEGIEIRDNGAIGNRVAGNYVGTDKYGTADLGNTGEGIYIAGAPNNTVGGTTIAERNVISHNSYGVWIDGPSATSNRIMLNVISANEFSGVGVDADATVTGNRILSNSIFSNGDLGIDLNDDGPTANDPGDKDTGANNLQNKPVLSSSRKGATGTTTIKGNLNSTPGKTFNLQFFSNPEGTNEGKTLLGSKSVTTNGSGNVSFTFSTKKAIRLGQNITATATGPGGNTSEFSAPRKVVAQ